MAEFDRGRLIRNAQADPESPASIETNLLATGGMELLVNADLAGGVLGVGVVDVGGNLVEGYGIDDSMLSTYDDLRYLVSWTSHSALPLAGEYGLRFELDGGASLYAFELLPIVLPGDANEDGVVDGSDATILAANWLASDADWSMGDFNEDGIVNDIDATLMAANWSSAASASVSEPAALGMLAMGGIVLLCRWLRRNKKRNQKPNKKE